MRKLLIYVVGLWLLLGCLPLVAQDGPPKRLELIIEDVKPGKGAAHEKSEATWTAAFVKSKLPLYGIGMTSMTGRNDAWFVSDMGTWANWESLNKQVDANAAMTAEVARIASTDGDLINGSHTYFLDFVPELSYRPNLNIGEMKYMMVDTIRVRPGHGKDFSDLRKAINAAHEKANMDEHMVVYYAAIGASGGTYFIFEPLKNVASLDDIDKWHGDDSAYQKALGDDFRKMSREFAATGLISTETNLLAINPKMSYVSQETAKAAPDFWNPKAVAVKAKPKDGTTATPAAQKEKK